MEVTFWGVRGAIPAPGQEFNRYGGNTPCVSVRADDTLLILDAGTGITVLGRALMDEAFGSGKGTATVLLTHAHWDHIQGFPFFTPVHVPGNRFVIYGPSESPSMLEGILEGQMNPHFSPVQTVRNLGASIEFRAVQEGDTFHQGTLAITAGQVPHGKITSLAYRIDDGKSSLIYVPDAGYVDDSPSAAIQQLYRDADCLIHDCTYTSEDLEQRRCRGYSSVAIAASVAATCAVKKLVLFHYDQDYDDAMVDGLAEDCRRILDATDRGASIEVIAAAEGSTVGV